MRAFRMGMLALATFQCSAVSAEITALFWNLTGSTIVDFRLSRANENNFGPNQCVNDKDGAVDNDERLRITDTPPGSYDASLTFKNGRNCRVKHLTIEASRIFTVEEKDLADCDR